MSTVVQAGAGWATSGVNLTLSSAQTPLGVSVTAGNSLVVTANQETALNDITGITDSGGNTWVTDVNKVADAQGLGRCVFRCQSVGTVPTWIKVSATTSGTIFYTFTEISALHATPFENYFSVVDGSNVTTHGPAFTPATNNCVAVCLATSGGDQGTITPTNGFTEIPTTRNGRAGFYIADTGTAGAKTLGYTSSAANNVNHLIAVYKSAVTDPTVSTVSSPTATEGSPLAFLITLSGATNRSTDYVFTLTGTATGSDYTSTITTAMCDNSVTVSGASGSGGTFTVPTSVTSFTVTVPTTSDTIDEADETVILTLPGSVSGTGTITDDDAPPTFSVTDASENAMQVVFTVSLSQASGKSITVDYATANGTKTAGTDYTAASGTLTFAAGETTKTVTVAVL